MQNCRKSSYDTFTLNFETLLVMTLMQKCSKWEDINYQSSDSLLYPLLLSLGVMLCCSQGLGLKAPAGPRNLGILFLFKMFTLFIQQY